MGARVISSPFLLTAFKERRMLENTSFTEKKWTFDLGTEIKRIWKGWEGKAKLWLKLICRVIGCKGGFGNEAGTKQPWLPSWMFFMPGRRECGFVHLPKVSKHPGRVAAQSRSSFLHLVMHIGPVDMGKTLVGLCVSHISGCVWGTRSQCFQSPSLMLWG